MNQIWPEGTTAAAIAASIEEGLHQGRLAPGEPLPTVRALAGQLKVSPVTVSAAYRLLGTRGLVRGDRRRGTRVAVRPPVAASPFVLPVPAGAIDLANGNPDPALLPPLEPALQAIAADAIAVDGFKVDGIKVDRVMYGVDPVLPELAAFAIDEFQQDGIAAQTIAVLSGALDAIERALREHLRPGDGVAIEDPSFPGLAALATASGWTAHPVAVDDEGPQPDALAVALRRGCRAAIVSPRAQNPTGAALTPARVEDLAAVLGAHQDLLLIENDHSGPVAGAPALTLTASQQRWAVIRSTSKFLGPDLRVAVMTGDPLTLNRVRGRQALGARWVSHLLQRLVVRLWSDPANGRRLARAADVYAGRRSALLSALTDRHIHAHGRSGLNVWIPVAEETHVVHQLAEHGWAVAAGERFRTRAGPGIRVTVAGLAATDAPRFADSLSAVLTSASAGFA